MKKKYIIPKVEILVYQLQSHLLEHSIEGGGNFSGDYGQGTEGDVKAQRGGGRGVWDDDWSKQ